MFNQEIDLIEEFMQTYKDLCVKYELELGPWLDGDYKNLVPRIFLQMRAMRNFIGYLKFALENDQYPDRMRIIDPERLSENHYGICDEYRPFFGEMSYMTLQHLIGEVEKFGVCRHNLREEIWEESDYWNFKTLESLMRTICLICDHELRDPNSYYEESEAKSKDDDEVECEWMYDDYLYDDMTPDRALPRWVTVSQIESYQREGIVKETDLMDDIMYDGLPF